MEEWKSVKEHKENLYFIKSPREYIVNDPQPLSISLFTEQSVHKTDYKNSEICLALKLMNMKQGLSIQESQFVVRRFNACFLSTPFDLFVIGGKNSNYFDLRSCERFFEEKTWVRIPDLNESHQYINGCYIYPSFIYVFNTDFDKYYEVFDIKAKNNNKWSMLHTEEYLRHEILFTFQIKEEEVLFLGKNGEEGMFINFNLKKRNYSNEKFILNQLNLNICQFKIYKSNLCYIDGDEIYREFSVKPLGEMQSMLIMN